MRCTERNRFPGTTQHHFRASLTYTLPNFARFFANNESILSEQSVLLGGFPFRIYTTVVNNANEVPAEGVDIPQEEKWLGFYISCHTDADGGYIDIGEWEFCVSVVLSLYQHAEGEESSGDEGFRQAVDTRGSRVGQGGIHQL